MDFMAPMKYYEGFSTILQLQKNCKMSASVLSLHAWQLDKGIKNTNYN